MIHSTVSLSKCQALLCCAACPVCLSGCVGLHRSLGHRINLEQGAFRQLPLGTGNYIPTRPCLHIEVQQEVLMKTSFMNRIGFL